MTQNFKNNKRIEKKKIEILQAKKRERRKWTEGNF